MSCLSLVWLAMVLYQIDFLPLTQRLATYNRCTPVPYQSSWLAVGRGDLLTHSIDNEQQRWLSGIGRWSIDRSSRSSEHINRRGNVVVGGTSNRYVIGVGRVSAFRMRKSSSPYHRRLGKNKSNGNSSEVQVVVVGVVVVKGRAAPTE